MANSIENSDHNPLMVSLDHVQICVPEAGLAEARAFYGGVLGLAEIPKPQILRERGGAWYRCGDRQIHLGALPDSPTTYRAPEKAHVAVQVTDLDAIRQRLAAAGAPIDVDAQIPGFQRFYTRDPFGNRLEFLQRLDAGAVAPASSDASADAASQIKERVRQNFGRAAHAYVVSPGHASGHDLAELVELATPTATDRALDVSTGGGHTALALAPLVAEVVASDLTPAILAAARDFISGRGVHNVSFVIADAEQLPFLDGSFDLVTVRIAPHHYAAVQKAIHEMARVLVPGGRLVVVDSLAPEETLLDQSVNDWEKRRDPSHVRDYTETEWRRFLEAAGLAVQRVKIGCKPIDYATWAERMQMPGDEQQQLAADILAAPEPVRSHFQVTQKDGRLVSWSLGYIAMVATK